MKKIILFLFICFLIPTVCYASDEIYMKIDTPNFKQTGKWQISQDLLNYDGSYSKYSTDPSASARFSVDVTGAYNVYFYHIKAKNDVSEKPMQIEVLTNKIEFVSSQKPIGWVYLGAYEFTGFEAVTVSSNGEMTRIGAIKLVPKNEIVKLTIKAKEKPSAIPPKNDGAIELDTKDEQGIYIPGMNIAGVYIPQFPNAGQYIVSVYNPRDGFVKAKVYVFSDGETKEVQLGKAYGTGYIDIGVFDFKADRNEFVRILSETAKIQSVKFTKFTGQQLLSPAFVAKSTMPDHLRPPEYAGGAASDSESGAKSEIVVDLKSANYSDDGTWKTSSTVKGHKGGATKYASSIGAKAKYNASGVRAGVYTVSFYSPVFPDDVKNGKVKSALTFNVKANGKISTLKAAPSKTEAMWIAIGSFEFSGNADEYVEIIIENGTGVARIDAVSFIKK